MNTKGKTGIIVAMDKELALLLPMLENHKEIHSGGYTFHTGSIGAAEVVAMKCGIGKVNAAVGTVAMIDAFAPALIINTGVAGGTGGGAGILDVVIADSIAYHDVWCGPGTPEGEASGCPLFFTPPQWVAGLEIVKAGSVKTGLVCSGDRFISQAYEVSHIKSIHPGAMAVDMESAAIAQVCHMRGVDFVCVRVISDTPGEADNIAQYTNFWEDAPRHTFDTLRTILAAIS